MPRRRRENFGHSQGVYKGFTLIFERRRREIFGILDRLHKGFTPILERCRQNFFETYKNILRIVELSNNHFDIVELFKY